MLSLLILVVISTGGCASLNRLTPAASREIAGHRQWNRGGQDALDKRNYDKAQECFERAMLENPNDARVMVGLAESLAGQGDLNRAVSIMQRAVSIQNDPMLQVRLGETHLANGQWLPARQAAQTAISSGRQLAPAWVLKGRTEAAKGNLAEALSDYQRALSLDPGMREMQLEIAAIYHQLDQPMRALSTIEQYMSEFPEDRIPERAVIAKGVALMELRQYPAAVDVLQAATQLPEATANAFVFLSRAQSLVGETSQARTTLARTQARFPDANIPADPGLDSVGDLLQPERTDVAMSSANPEFPR